MERTDESSRVIAASTAACFGALVDPDARAQWLPPTGMTGAFEWFDARPGGGYRLVLTYDDTAARGKAGENRDVVDARFLVVEEPHQVVEAVEFASTHPSVDGTMTMTWALEPHPDGASVTITARDVPPGISADDHAAGLASTLANLDQYVRQRAKP